MPTEKFQFDTDEQARSFAEKVSSSDAYEGSVSSGWYQTVEVDTDKVKDAQAIGTFAGTRGGKTVDN